MKAKSATISSTLILASVLLYGYWHVSSHGSLHISLSRPLPDAELQFCNSAGTVLARAKATEPSGVVYLSHPASYACHDVEQRAPFSPQARKEWDACFERQSRWLVTWVRQIKYVNVKSGACQWREIPVSLSTYRDDWWLWWVPLPHIGGKPYTTFTTQITVDPVACPPADRPAL